MFNLVMFTISTIVVAIVLRAWVFTILWGWFLVPLGAPEVSIPTAIGISLILNLFMQHLAKEETKDKNLIAEVGLRAIGAPVVTLILGWIVTLFV